MGTPCCHGHDGLRFTKCRNCVVCSTAAVQRYLAKSDRPRKPATKRPRVMVQVEGCVAPLRTACAALGISYKAVCQRVRQHGVPHQQAVDFHVAQLNDPNAPKRQPKKLRVPREPTPRKPRTPGHFVENAELLAEIIRSQQRDKITDQCARMLMLMVDRFFKRRNYHRYGYRDELQDAALMQTLHAVMRFDTTRTNPFAYLTTVMRNAANHVFRQKKRHQGALSELRLWSEVDLEEGAPGATSRRRTTGEHRTW